MKTNPGTAAALAVGTLLMSLLSFAPTALAKVVYTPVNVTVRGDASIDLDLNHDGKPDFVLRSTSHITQCGTGGGLTGSTTITPAQGGGVVLSVPGHAAILPSGVPIDARQSFGQGVMTVFQFECLRGHTGIAGYLGLEGSANGQTRYGWAAVQISAIFQTDRGGVTTTVYGVAFETIPGKTIQTGQTSDQLDDARNIPESPSSPSVLVPVHLSRPFLSASAYLRRTGEIENPW